MRRIISSLVDGRALPPAEYADSGPRCERFRAWVVTMYEANQRSSRMAIRAIHSIFRHGGAIVPGFEDWPHYGCGRIPTGCSESSLYALLQAHSKRELLIARQGYKAAASMRLPVLTTRRGIAPGSLYMFDDVVHDHLVLVGGQAARILEFGCFDVASACRIHWGNTARITQATGKRQGLTQKMFVMFIAYVLRYIGYNLAGCTLVMEHNTASLPDETVALLKSSGLGISVRMGGIEGGRQRWIGGYNGQMGGNPRGKAGIENSHSPLHNLLGDLPGQVGKDRQHIREATYGVVKAQEQVERWRGQLRAMGRDDLADALANHILTYRQFNELLAIKYALWGSRTNHELEGWEDHTTIEYQTGPNQWTPAEVLTSGGTRPLSPVLVEAVRTNPDLVRERRLSPAEVWESGKGDLVRIPLYVDLIKGDKMFGQTVTVRGCLLTVQDKYVSPGKLHYLAEVYCDGRKQLLEDGRKVRVVLNPYHTGTLIVLDDTGRILGEAPLYSKVSPLDTEALHEQMGRVDSINVRRDQLMRARYESEGARVAGINEHNRTLAKQGGVYGRRAQIAATSTQTPADKAAVTRAANRSEIDVFEGLGELPIAPVAAATASLPEPPASGSDITLDDIIY